MHHPARHERPMDGRPVGCTGRRHLRRLLALPQVRGLEQQFGLPWLFRMRGPVDPPGDVVLVLMSQDAAANISLPREPEMVPSLRGPARRSAPATHVGLPPMPSRWPRCVHASYCRGSPRQGPASSSSTSCSASGHLCRDPTATCMPGRTARSRTRPAAARVIVAQKVEATDGHEELARLSPAIEEAALASAPFPLLAEPGRRVDRFMAFKEDGLASATMPAVAVSRPFDRRVSGTAGGDRARSHGVCGSTCRPRSRNSNLRASSRRRLSCCAASCWKTFHSPAHSRSTERHPRVAVRRRRVPHSQPVRAVRQPALRAIRRGAWRDGRGECSCVSGPRRVRRIRGNRANGTGRALRDCVLVGDRADLSGVEIAATAFANLLGDRTIREVPFRFWPPLVFLAGLLAYGVCRAFGNRVAIAIMSGFVVAYGLTAVALFDSRISGCRW